MNFRDHPEEFGVLEIGNTVPHGMANGSTDWDHDNWEYWDMSPTRCSYFLCGRTIRRDPGMRTFAFPVNDPSRCQKWLENSGNSELMHLNPYNLKKHAICERHFRKSDFLSRKLTRTAIPIEYKYHADVSKTYSRHKVAENDFKTPLTAEAILDHGPSINIKKLPEKRKIDNVVITSEGESVLLKNATNLPSLPTSAIQFELNNLEKNLERELAETQNELAKTRRVYSSLKRKRALRKSTTINSLPPFARTFIRMQLYHKRGTPWLSVEKSTALSLFYKSPGTYKFLRSKGIILPSIAMISKWLEEYIEM